ncbi:ABC transporter permease [Burkholderia sp. IDO3]|uniref:ABC transporter permease n=1 Tax=Burkholderia sp. IDO3 TaxID=1705310 RepID=UPI000BBA6B83|nr:ABC transporter permease [Burkholderia sp. IDO3]AXK64595.1 ABC transporter permease [Burkholderia sp. IDO3]PCD60593.1 ABC transporter permease [Burkholderia sp. IDO3]
MIIGNIKKYRLFIGIVVVPMLLAIIYYVFLARDRYISTSQVVVKKVGSDGGGGATSAQMPGLAVLLSGGMSSSIEETLYVRQFILSQDMLNILQRKINWSSHYSGNIRDFWFRLSPNASQEELFKYYQRVVKANIDEQTGLLTIEVQAFDKKFAEKTLAVIISESDQFVNDISHRLSRQQVDFAEEELERSRRTFEVKRDSLLHFQSNNNMLDAQQTALAQNSVITGLQADLTKASTTLRGMRASLSEDSPQVRQQKIQVQAIQQQIIAEQKKLIARNSSGQLNVAASKYHNLEIDAGIAEDTYKAAVTSLDNARVEAVRKLRSLIVVVNPNMPDESLLPKRLYGLFTVLVISLLVYGITLFVIATINDHKD